ncbi:MAG TPA: tetratricopeptide repeat protein, partial [Thermoanaerobaculia bacterium]|nr:tetratricopeptide repeat protein [Thermoanaerobaculia bacterium]
AELARTLTLVALADKALGDYRAADAAFVRAGELQERLGPTAELDLAMTLANRGHLLQSVDEAAQALPLFRRAQALRERRLGRDSPAAVASLLDVGSAELELGHVDAAIAAGERVFRVAKHAYGDDHSLTAYGLGQLAAAWGAKGDLPRARELYGRAIASFTALTGPASQMVLIYRRALGQLLVAAGDGRAGVAELESVLAAYERTLGPDHPRTGSALIDLAEARMIVGERSGVEAQLRRGLDVLRRQLAPDSTRVAAGESRLGALLCEEGRGAEGAPLLREAVGVLRAARPAGDRDLAAADTALRTTCSE